jgi:hypothetical protein
MLQTFATQKWNEHIPESDQQRAIRSLESGEILSPHYADPHAKNISYSSDRNKLWGVQQLTDTQHNQLKAMMDRFSRYAFQLIQSTLPRYAAQVIVARTSYRPVQISDRKTSYRKDDKRLHVDAFPSAPNQGKRILRVFCNINPEGGDRVWRVGEPFTEVAKRFVPQINKPLPGAAALLRLLRITKSYRTPYDHYMLHMHDLMKADERYQQEVAQTELRFNPGNTWIVQTDHVSHAALEGQYLLEQTFYLPVKAMQIEALSPLRVLEGMLGEKLAP